MMKPFVAAALLAVFFVAPAIGQDMNPNGTWVDQWGTSFTFELCGDGTQLCGTLVWLSDVDYNKQYERFLNSPVASAIKQTGPNRWKGDMQLLGHKINGTITQRSETQMTLQGCAFLVVCKTYQMFKVSE